MTEFNKDKLNSIGTNKKVEFKGQTKKELESQPAIESTQIKDLKNTPAEYLGRSQVQNTYFHGKLAESVKADLDVLKNNPAVVMDSDIMFEGAYNKLSNEGHKDAYAKAAAMQTRFVQEFAK